jgi:hypothetical protein
LERRTHPGFLSDGEAARDAARTTDLVRGLLKWKPAVKVGETNNFAVDFDRSEKLVLVYGKETPKECPFKLAFNESEIDAILDLLAKAKAFFQAY